MSVIMLKIRALSSFEVPSQGVFAEGSEYYMIEGTAAELAARGLVEILETEKPVQTGKKGKIVTT